MEDFRQVKKFFENFIDNILTLAKNKQSHHKIYIVINIGFTKRSKSICSGKLRGRSSIGRARASQA